MVNFKRGQLDRFFQTRQLADLIRWKPLSGHLFYFFLLVIWSIFLTLPFSAQARFTQKVDLPPEVMGKMNLVLRFNDALYAALISKNDQLVVSQIVSLDTAIADAQQVVAKEQTATRDSAQPFIHGRALQDSFSEMRQYLNQAYRKDGETRRTSLRELFKRVVLLTKLYSIPHSYKIFFCQADRSVWLQRGSKARNPTSVDTHPNCGILVH